jgi:DNA-binding GntR family transcriptional regulator
MPPVPDLQLQLPRTPNLTELVYQRLKKRMLDGSLLEGARLTEDQLAKQLGISKSPVREALNRLEAEGLIRIQARRGANVRKFTYDETRDIFDLRVLLEEYSVEIAKITPELLREMEASIQRTLAYLEPEHKLAHVEEDIHFHSLIAASSGNGEFYSVFLSVQDKTILSRSKTYHLSPSSAPVSHQKIYEAFAAGNRSAAKQLMREHILFLRDSLLTFIQQSGEGTMPGDELVLDEQRAS